MNFIFCKLEKHQKTCISFFVPSYRVADVVKLQGYLHGHSYNDALTVMKEEIYSGTVLQSYLQKCSTCISKWTNVHWKNERHFKKFIGLFQGCMNDVIKNRHLQTPGDDELVIYIRAGDKTLEKGL